MIESEYASLNSNHQTAIIEDDQKETIQIHESFELEEQFKLKNNLYWGKCKPFMFKNNKPNVVIGPHWPFFLVAYCLFLGLSVALIIYAFMTLSLWLVSCTILVCLAQLIAYAQVFLRNPGIANIETVYIQPSLRGEKRKRNENWFCGVCNLSQSPTTAHCSDCQVCIYEMDHHCPWTSKCVGKGNLRDFYLFLFTTVVFLVFNLVLSMSVSLQNSQQK